MHSMLVIMRTLGVLLALSTVWVIGLLFMTGRDTKLTVYNRSGGSTARCQCDSFYAQVQKENTTSERATAIAAKLSETESTTTMANRQDKKSGPWGYIVALKHYEQQTQAFRNYLQLQCLANSYGMRTVEPFLERSFLSFPFDSLLKGKKIALLRDLIDVDLWDKQTGTKYGYQPMSSLDDFIRSAPRNVVLGCIRYQEHGKLHVPQAGSNFRLGCPDECFLKFEPAMEFLKPHGFTVVQKACANFRNFAGAVTTESFFENLLQRYKPEETTIFLTEFRGLFGLYRLPILSDCGIIHHKLNISAMPSIRITRDSQDYISQNFGLNPYIAIIVRMERIVVNLLQNITTCIEDLEGKLVKLHTETKLPKKYFLAMDVGNYGSQGSADNHLLPHGHAMFKSIFKDTWSFEKWEESFKSFARSNVTNTEAIVSDDAGYIANIQRVIAARSDCLVMVGGGGFQGQAKEYYYTYHPDPKTHCIYQACM